MSDSKETYTEEFKVAADNLVDEIKKLVHEGTVRQIVIKDEFGNVKYEIPLAAGVVGVLLLPVFAAVAGLAVIASNYTIAVTREKDPEPAASPEPEASTPQS